MSKEVKYDIAHITKYQCKYFITETLSNVLSSLAKEKNCPLNLEYLECGSPCSDSCSDPERELTCDDYCIAGCFCPQGLIFDDINNQGCIPFEKCYCTYNGELYAPGTSYATPCRSCTCSGGKWDCVDIPCSATCSIEGGSHITTFDGTNYDILGDCTYVIAKLCEDSTFTVLAELRPCGRKEVESCMTSVTIITNEEQTIEIISTGDVYMNWMYASLPIISGNFTVFQPSPYYIVFNANFGPQIVVQVDLSMHVYVTLGPSYNSKTCGLCGNYNNQQNDDFKTISGVIEGTAAAFANTWKTAADCPSVKVIYDDPCSVSIESEEYAKHWCGLLRAIDDVFTPCHAVVDPAVYYKNCLTDACSCENSEACMCAALQSYNRACSIKGIILKGWQAKACGKYILKCPKNLVFSFNITSCLPTCRSLSELDMSCNVHFYPLPGCTCDEGNYIDDTGRCVPAAECPCYFRGTPIPSGETINENGLTCNCTMGKLFCNAPKSSVCIAPKIYIHCDDQNPDTRGLECLKSCHTLDMQCYKTRCIPGCVCPSGLVSDDNYGCIEEKQCPCMHNDIMYKPGEEIRIQCNTCICKDRMWRCTKMACLATCTVYGDGHYTTFDGKRYNFNGDCQYTLAQDHCSLNDNDTFRIITENIPCGTTGVTCSKSLKVFFGSYELILSDKHLNVVQRSTGTDVPYRIRLMGIYLVLETKNGLLLLWDKKTSIFIKVTDTFKGKLCGLCGNYDGNANNDFTTRSNAVVGNIEEFGNSWKMTPLCPDAKTFKDPCSLNPYRLSWAQKQCSIITSEVFSVCHPHVDPSKFHDTCISDSCACNTGGDCECFCTAVAAYAQTCGEYGICVSWRDPSRCPLFCDYYNDDEECEWHYKPCGAPCMKTCRNPSGKCAYEIRGLEGCYPKCPKGRPLFDEDEMKCVSKCGCYDEDRRHYRIGARVPSRNNCDVCYCTEDGIKCVYIVKECQCEYDDHMFKFNETIYNTTDGIGHCIVAICKENGTIYRNIYPCATAVTTPFTFTTVSRTVSTVVSPRTSTVSTVVSSRTPTQTSTATQTVSGTTQSRPTTKIPVFTSTSATAIPSSIVTTSQKPSTICKPQCKWTSWFSVNTPSFGFNGGETENYKELIQKGKQICKYPEEIKCQPKNVIHTIQEEVQQSIHCNLSVGLVCINRDQITNMGMCFDYEISFLCCDDYSHCAITPPSTTTSATKSTYLPPSSKTTQFTIKTTTTKSQATVPTVVSPRTSTVSTVVSSRTPTQTSTATQTVSGTTQSRPTTKIPVFISTSATAIPSSIVTTSQKPSTICKPQCKWTSWFSVNTPSFGFNGGETENYEELIQKGKQICKYPEEIKCQPKNGIHTIQEEVQQSIHCNLSVGLVCINRDQITNMGMCFDYEISFLCCDDYSHCAITPPSTTTSATKIPTVVSPRTSTVSTVVSSRTPTQTSTATQTISGTTQSRPTTKIPVFTSTSATAIPSSIVTTSQKPSTICKPQCKWTSWFSVNTPSFGFNGGETENYEELIQKGKQICKYPEEIKCQPKNVIHTIQEEVHQSIHCNLSVGLVCINRDQITNMGMCFDYEISFLCCDDYSHCAITPPSTTTSATKSTYLPPSSKTTPFTGKSPTTPKQTVTSPTVIFTTKISTESRIPTISTRKTPTTSVQTGITETKRSATTLLYSTSASTPTATQSRSTATKETFTPSAVASTSKISFPTSQISISTKKTPTTSVQTGITETKHSTTTLLYSTSASTPTATKSRSTATKETFTPSAVASTSKISFPASQISISTKKTPTTSVQTGITETKRSTTTLLYSTSAFTPTATQSRSTATKETFTPSAVASTSKISFPTSQISISTKKTPTTSVQTGITETKRSTTTLLYSTSASTPTATKSRSTATKETFTPSAVASTSKISFPASQISISTKKTPTTSVQTGITETKRSTTTLLYSTSASTPTATKSRSTATKETFTPSAVASTSKISFPTSQISTAISTKIATTSKSPPTSTFLTSAITTTKSPITSGQTKTTALTSSSVASTTKISTSTSLPTSATPPIKTSFSPTTPTGTVTTPKVTSTTKISIYTSQLSSSSSSTIELTQTAISMSGTSSPTTSTAPTKTTATITTIQSSTTYPTTTIFTSTICQCDVSGTIYSPG
ncbi:mucin-5AC-like [Pelobates fuscus]|uniref:mucin-5AC-like n=1 Tax=Pelobates fuscus TaxID=191477 RepID=UPI002FE438B8